MLISCWLVGPLLLLTLISETTMRAELRRLQDACDRGAHEACEELGWAVYGHGEDVHDMRRALAIFRRSCHHNHASSCASAASVAEEDLIGDVPAAFAFARRACELGAIGGCMDVIRGFPAEDGKRRAGTRAEALAALARLEAQCDSALPAACWLAAIVRGRGEPGALEPDRAGAIPLLHSGCAAGHSPSCEAVRRASEPGPSQDHVDDLREFLVRQQLRGREHHQDGEPVWCLAVAADTSDEGADPDPSLLLRLADVPSVRPVSWCRERRQGTIVSLGPVSNDASWPPAEGLATWVVTYLWHGGVHAYAQRLAKREGAWTYVSSAAQPRLPEMPTMDRAGDRRRIAAALAALVEAWNRGDEELPVRSFIGDPSTTAQRPREHTRLVWQEPEATFDSTSAWALTAEVEVPLLGTFEPQPGVRWPIEPWKQSGARTSVRLVLQRTSGWWREGEWALRSIVAPWNAQRAIR